MIFLFSFFRYTRRWVLFVITSNYCGNEKGEEPFFRKKKKNGLKGCVFVNKNTLLHTAFSAIFPTGSTSTLSFQMYFSIIIPCFLIDFFFVNSDLGKITLSFKMEKNFTFL